MIRKFYEGGKVTLWGDGSPKREFLHADDLAEACYVCMKNYESSEHINVGVGEDICLKDLANIIANIVGYTHQINWDTSKPNGTLQKVLNIDKIKNLGWEPTISLYDGIKQTFEWYKKKCLNML
jgi:GDP-L-fucose synthase